MLLKLTIAYDGTRFGGWQIQPNADTIQERIEGALGEVAKEKIRLHGLRTDRCRGSRAWTGGTF